MLDKRLKKFLPLFIVLFVFLITLLVFVSRAPILIVSDISFNRIYGPMRLKLKGFSISREYFRRVIEVSVAESAGPDLVAIAVEAISRRPYAVLFPYRYLEGARYYKNSRPKVPVLVVGGRNPAPHEETDLCFVVTDLATDLYRAGIGAAYIAADERVLLFSDGSLPNQYREAIREGLRMQGSLMDPIFVNSSVDYSSFSGVGCIIVAGPASRFLERNLKIPVVLFSWIDPGVTPRTVKIVFDDSPWALAIQALKSLPSDGEELLLSSEPQILKDRIEDKKDFRLISAYLKEELEKN